MHEHEKIYIAIDLKSFYASVECVERGLNPLTTNLVVADASRTEKTICLAVSPALKAHGIPGRPRLFQVIQKVKEANGTRALYLHGKPFSGTSCDDVELKKDPSLAIDYIAAPPRMAYYLEYSTKIYEVYLKYIAPEDIHVYSIDEVFLDVTGYLDTYGMSPHDLAMTIMNDVLRSTGITATAGIGTNLYLAKIAMDIVAKHMEPDENGVRIAQLDEMSYRRLLWGHRPITDFWRVGAGYAKKLAQAHIYTMGDVARCSLGKETDFYNEELLYKMFGVNAELLIDHAWGIEPCTIQDIKSYKPENSSIGSGQVLPEPYTFGQTRLVVKEMADLLAYDLIAQKLVTEQLVLTVGYDRHNLDNGRGYQGELMDDRYGRKVPKHAHGTIHLGKKTASSKILTEKMLELYDRIVDPNLLVRRVNVSALQVMDEKRAKEEAKYQQMDFFSMLEETKPDQEQEKALEKEKKMQEAAVALKQKFGKNIILKGMNLQEGATARNKNRQIGGHKA